MWYSFVIAAGPQSSLLLCCGVGADLTTQPSKAVSSQWLLWFSAISCTYSGSIVEAYASITRSASKESRMVIMSPFVISTAIQCEPKGFHANTMERQPAIIRPHGHAVPGLVISDSRRRCIQLHWNVWLCCCACSFLLDTIRMCAVIATAG
jgi:hypothetical protein